MKAGTVVAITLVYLVGGTVAWMVHMVTGADSPQIFWVLGAVTGVLATATSQLDAQT